MSRSASPKIIPNKAFIYKSVPDGWPIPGKDLAIETRTFDLSAPPPANGVTTKNLYAAFDPTQRSAMRSPSIKSYHDAMVPGSPVTSISVISRVLKSDNPKFHPGDLIISMIGTEEYSSIPSGPLESAEVIHNPHALPLSAYLGAMGMTGLTAYGSLLEIARPQPGETMFLSGAAGAVGLMVGQFALRMGVKVIGSVGDDAKLSYIVNELGFTAGFNYKRERAASALARLAPDGIDIYYDNVGGEQLDDAIAALRPQGRIVASGSISQYNLGPDAQYGIKNTPLVVRKRLRWQGFLVWDDNIAKYKGERDDKVGMWLKDGSVRNLETVTHGIDGAVHGFLAMLSGQGGLGKAVLKIAVDEKED